MVEQFPLKEAVVGSSPTGPTGQVFRLGRKVVVARCLRNARASESHQAHRCGVG